MQLAEDIASKGTLGAGRPGEPCVMVIFGASGDLTKRKLIPALYNLAKDNLLSKEFALVGIARNELTSEQFRDEIGKEIGEFATTTVDPDLWHWFSQRIYYHSGDFGEPAAYKGLSELLAQIDKEHGTRGNYFYYLATAPSFFGPIVTQLGEAGLVNEDHGWRRVIIEKPFGHNYESAVALNKEIRTVLDEKQIYRIDHYLGKETVQNILVFRFANGLFERCGKWVN
jgi:glucose-6-phosphate 1-dehydrogenase